MSRKSKAVELERPYDINITGRNVLVTDAMKNYAMDKLSKIERFSHRIIDINIIMDIQKLEHRVDVLCLVENTKIKCSASSDNMYASIDVVVDKLAEQLRRRKSRVQDHQSKTHEDVAMNVNVYSPVSDDELLDFNEDIEETLDRQLYDNYRPHKVVSQETKPLKTLNNKEAILKMDISGDAFLIFRCEEDMKIKVIYRRKDGNYGVIEPES